MGLDQMMFAVEAHPKNTDFGYSDDAKVMPFGNWRKHPNLQGWMEKIYNSKADVQGYEGNTVFNDGYIANAVGELSKEETTEIMRMAASTQDEMRQMIEKEQENARSARLNKTRVFNQQCIRLNIGDIDQLEMAIKNGELPATEGFFFGDDSSEHYKEYDLKIVEAAKKALSLGLEVYYDSWW